MPKVSKYISSDGREGYVFHCVACGWLHQYVTKRGKSDAKELPEWSFNGDVERPTFRASLINNADRANKAAPRCHLHVTDGRIEYCSDCTHDLAGQVVPMVELDHEEQH